jgi:HlyD family secretion protein
MDVHWKRRLTWLVVLVVIVGALGYGFRAQPRLVDMAVVKRAPLQVAIEQEGKTRVVDRYIVSAPVAGTACRIELDVGDKVEQGQPLLMIRPLQSQALDPRSRAEAEAQISAAEAALRAAEQTVQSARANAEFASKEVNRLQPLAVQGHVSHESLDAAAASARSKRAELRSAEFAVDVARHELSAARTSLLYTGSQGQNDPTDTVQVIAPVTGRVLKIQQECEGVVNAGQPLLEIGDTRSLEIETDVLSADAVRLKPGMTVIYERWGGDEPLRGLVRRIEPVGFTKISALGVEEQRVLVISDITSDAGQWQALGHGYRVESRFVLWEEQDVLQIPASALFRAGDGLGVFLSQNDTAKRRIVDVGQRNGLSAQIVKGLSEGEEVIINPDNTIEEGVVVKRR